MILRLAVCNVPIKVGREAWAECFEQTADHGDLFGLNEAHSHAQKRTFLRLARERGLRQYGLAGPNPIFSAPGVWRRTHDSIYRLHGRGPWCHRWPGYNSARRATVGLYEPVIGVGPDVALINAHLVPRGRKVPAWWRERARRRSTRILSRIIARHVARGRVVVVMGDLNMAEAPALPGVEWVVGATRGVDKIGVACPAGWEITAQGADRFRAPTDHGHGVAASVELLQEIA